MRRARFVCLLLTLLPLFAEAQPAQAAPTPAQQLVARYAPILEVRKQENPPCDESEEQYEPTTVNTVLGNPLVVLQHIQGKNKRAITNAPTAAQIAGLDDTYFLNLPGDPITNDCGYARDFAALKKAGKAPAVTYARLAGEAGTNGLVVQYWFFWYFNQFNDVHEGDWEGMQITFDGTTPQEALRNGPDQIGLFQHGGGETADWDDERVQKEGTHPVVYPAAGSHATFFSSAVWLQTGQGGAGLGCDNTTEPLRRIVPRPELIPTNPVKGGPDQWLTYDGHWGQKEKGYNNGPQGPNTKRVWFEPFSWMDTARLASPRLPGGGIFGSAGAKAFCGAVAAVSAFVNAESRSPLGVIGIGAFLILLCALPIVLTRWRPVDLDQLRRKRAFGQLIRGARQLYGRYWRAFFPIALSAIPIIGAIQLLQTAYGDLAGTQSIHPAFAIGGARFDLSFTISGTLRPIGFALVGAAAVFAVRLLDRGEQPSAAWAWQLTLRKLWRLIGAYVWAAFLQFLMAVTIIGIPFAIWKYFAWQLAQQQIVFEDKGIREALKGSNKLVRHHWWRTFGTTGFLTLLTIATGPILGFVLIFRNVSLPWVNVITALVYMLLVPFEAIGRTLLYFDLQARQEEAAEAEAAGKPRRRWFRRRPRQPSEAPKPTPQPGAAQPGEA